MDIDRVKAKMRFASQKFAAKHRVDAAGNPIEWKLTFEEWFDIWLKSGHYDKCGRKRGCYVMSRFNDLGAYEVGNVFVQLGTDNIKQAQDLAKWVPILQANAVRKRKPCVVNYVEYPSRKEAEAGSGINRHKITYLISLKTPGYYWK
jgi:hypothetical protein